MTTDNISNRAVEAVLNGDDPTERAARIASLEKQLAKVRKDAEEQKKLEDWYALIQRANGKLVKLVRDTLTPEEWKAVDGAYLFIHGGCVDMVRSIPSSTSKGEDKQFVQRLDIAETIAGEKIK